MKRVKPKFAITLGDPDGVGPEIVFKALSDAAIKKLAVWKIFGSFSNKKVGPAKSGKLSLEALKEGIESIKRGHCDGLITAPISKERIQTAGFKFPGHTEYLAHEFGLKKSVMMFVSPHLKVSLVTIHIPLKKVPASLTTGKICTTIILTDQSLKKDFGIKKPKIAVCGLNPHAGENELFGDEERRIIKPAIRWVQKMGIDAVGPFSADTLFYQCRKGQFDAVIAHYHDQGLIPVKTLDFHHGVNMTLGLPFIRTSPDQGCAFDIAGKGIANPTSMKVAMQMAVKIWKRREKIV